MADKRPRMKRPAPLSDLLSSIFAGKPLGSRLKDMKVWQAWEEAVGEQIARRALPVSMRDGVLTVRVTSSPWLQQLSLMKPEILENLNRVIGEPLVREIFLKGGGQEKNPVAIAEQPAPSRNLSTTEQEWISTQTQAIPDLELRVSLANLLTRHLASRPGKQ